jgi:EAL domain-containing protein (putative c-di-GMP-specific phosphodiesterase class I)
VPKDYAGRLLVKTIITLARAFRLTTVAEGVETQEQLIFSGRRGASSRREICTVVHFHERNSWS